MVLGIGKRAKVEKAPGCSIMQCWASDAKSGEVQREEGQRGGATVYICLFQGCSIPQTPPRGNVANFNTRAHGSSVCREDLRGVIKLASCNDQEFWRWQYLGVGPAKSESSLMRKQLSKSQHQSVHKGKHQVDCGTSQDTPECWGLVKEHRGGGRRMDRRYKLVWRRVVFRVRWDCQAGLVELLGAGVGVRCHDAGESARGNETDELRDEEKKRGDC